VAQYDGEARGELARSLLTGIASEAETKKLESGEPRMSIQKKSLISTLKTAKKANVAASEADAKGSKVASMRQISAKATQLKSLKSSHTRSLRSLKAPSFKTVN